MKLSIVIAGWYFRDIDIYKTLVEEAKRYNNIETSYYIASHRRLEETDRELIGKLAKLKWQLLYFENEGWDWGAYQQFLIWQKKKVGLDDYYLFMHDDIKIKNYGFIGEFIKQIQYGTKVVGNGLKDNPNKSRKLTYPEIIYWSRINKFPIRADKWRCVRGSCFFTTRDVAENILIKMPIKKGHHAGFGNWSVIVFGGLVADAYGENSIEYIGHKEVESFYIREEYRGSRGKLSFKKLIRKTIQISPKSLRRFIKGQKAPPSLPGLKLNLGCGERYLNGYLNIDINSKYADLKEHILKLEFEEQTLSEVLMVHVIEHIDYYKVKLFLERTYFWLEKNGQLILEFPDVIKVAKCISRIKNDVENLQKSPFGIRGFYGKPTTDMTIYDYHKWGWSENTMKTLLKEIGFRKIYIEKPQFHRGYAERDSRVVAVK